jgi:hypothetical protein
MPRFRFSLLALFGFVTFAAVGCAALTSGSEGWCVCIVTSVFAFLGFAALVAIYGQLNRRAFWVGFAVIGWLYMGVFAINWPSGTESQEGVGSLGSHFLPGWALNHLLANTPTLDGDTWGVGVAWGTDGQLRAGRRYISGQCISALVSAIIGGLVARHLYLRRERDMAKNT